MRQLYCIVLYMQPVLNPKSYDGARVLEASGRPLLVKGRSYWGVPIQGEDVKVGTKLAEETTKKSSEIPEKTSVTSGIGGDEAATAVTIGEAETLIAGTKLMA